MDKQPPEMTAFDSATLPPVDFVGALVGDLSGPNETGAVNAAVELRFRADGAELSLHNPGSTETFLVRLPSNTSGELLMTLFALMDVSS